MPDLFFQVTEIGSNILDPLISQISEAVLARLGVRQYFVNSIYYDTNRSTSSISGDGSGNINLPRNRCDITVEDILNPAGVTWDMSTTGNQTAYGTSPTYRNQYQSIFHDPIAHVSILERTMPSAMFFTFKMKFLSFDAAQLAFSALLSQHHGTVVTTVHDVSYGYPLTLRMLEALSAVHLCRSSFSGDFNTYLETYSTVTWHRDIRKLDIGLTNPEFQLTVKRQQLRCQALLEFSQNEPEVERVGGAAQSYTVEFTYRVQYGRPNILQLVLPCAVENNPLPDVLFAKTPTNVVDFIQGYLQQMSFYEFIQTFRDYRPPPVILRLPNYDDFIPPSDGMLTTAKYQTFVSAVLTLDIPGPTIIPFTNLNDYQLDPVAIEIINLHSSDDLLGYQGLFNLTIFADESPLDSTLVTVNTSTLTVSINATVLSKTYRLVLSEATDLLWVHPKWYHTLLKYRYFFPLTVERNLRIFLGTGGVQVTSDPDLTSLIAKLMARRLLDPIIQAWISAGEATYRIYGYTQTPQQFGDYIALYKAGHTPDTTLYDLFITACLAANYITSDNIPGRSLRTPVGYPYGPNQGGFYAFNLPLRVFNTTIKPVHAS